MAKFESKHGALFIDGKQVVRGWKSRNGWYWFATEKIYERDSIIDGETVEQDTIWYGIVLGPYEEWTDFSQGELERTRPKVSEIPARRLPFQDGGGSR